MKTKPVIDKNPRNNEEIIASPEEKEGILHELRQVF